MKMPIGDFSGDDLARKSEKYYVGKKNQLCGKKLCYIMEQGENVCLEDCANALKRRRGKLYSIWICMNMEGNSMSHYHLTKDDMVGRYEWKGRQDLLNIILIGLSDELPGQGEPYVLHRLLGALLSTELTTDEKLEIIGNEYEIEMEEHFRKDVSVMCNLSQGIKEKGREEGRIQLIREMGRNGLTPGQIASITSGNPEEIRAILEKKEEG